MRFPKDFLLSHLLYRDGLMLVLDKPSGIAVHAGPKTPQGGGENLEDYFDALRFGLPRMPALAHRLDRETSGCLILGRHPKALRKLGKLFQDGKVEKTYLAIVAGTPSKPSGTIDAPLKKHSTSNGGWRMTCAETRDDEAQRAVTTYRTLHSSDAFSVIEAKPKTGRTHQIRVHLQFIGCPILGDYQYGDEITHKAAPRLMLHASKLVIPISKNKEPVIVNAPLPAEFAAFTDQPS